MSPSLPRRALFIRKNTAKNLNRHHSDRCGGVAGGSNPEYTDPIEKSVGTKAALVSALKESVAKCDEVYAKTDAANALLLVPAGKGDALRGMMLLDNVSHDNEHYGNTSPTCG